MNHTRLMTNNCNTYLASQFRDYLPIPAVTSYGNEDRYLEFHYDDYNFWGATIKGDSLYLANRDGRAVLSENLINKHLWSPER